MEQNILWEVLYPVKKLQCSRQTHTHTHLILKWVKIAILPYPHQPVLQASTAQWFGLWFSPQGERERGVFIQSPWTVSTLPERVVSTSPHLEHWQNWHSFGNSEQKKGVMACCCQHTLQDCEHTESEAQYLRERSRPCLQHSGLKCASKRLISILPHIEGWWNQHSLVAWG